MWDLGVIRVAAGVAVGAAVLAGCSSDEPGDPKAPEADHGTEYTPGDGRHITVGRGERFSLVVVENASVGDNWQLRTPPDQRIVKTEPDDYVPDGPPGAVGGGGRRFFVFTAAEPGDSSLELYNCFRGCQSPDNIEESTSLRVRLSVS